MDKAKLQAACHEPALQKLLYEGRFGLRMEAHGWSPTVEPASIRFPRPWIGGESTLI